MNDAASLKTNMALSPPTSPSRRVRRPAPAAAVAHIPPVRASPVQPALRDPQTGALTLQHPHSFQPAHNPASGAASERAAQPPEDSPRSYPEAATASASGRSGLANGVTSANQHDGGGAISGLLLEQQTVPMSCQQPAASEAYRIGRLWAHERFVASRLMALVALAKQLMSLPTTSRQDDAQVSPSPMHSRQDKSHMLCLGCITDIAGGPALTNASNCTFWRCRVSTLPIPAARWWRFTLSGCGRRWPTMWRHPCWMSLQSDCR